MDDLGDVRSQNAFAQNATLFHYGPHNAVVEGVEVKILTAVSAKSARFRA